MNPARNERSPKSVLKTVGLALGGLALVGGGYNVVKGEVHEQQQFNELNKPSLINEYNQGTVPGPLEGVDVVTIQRGQGETGTSVVNDIVRDGQLSEVAGMIEHQTNGQPGVAVVPESAIDMEHAVITPPEQPGELTSVSEPR